MRVVISQPKFLPWMGYLAQLDSCDCFVSFDTVQFNRRSWQNRNRIISRQGKIDYLTVNVKKGERNNSIRETFISSDYNPYTMEELVKNYYRGCSNFREASEISSYLFKSFHAPEISLADANFRQLEFLAELTGIEGKFISSSELESGLEWATPTERLLAICTSLGATEYLSSVGARPYMIHELHKFEEAGIMVSWQKFQHVSYVDEAYFISNLSCIDFIHHQSIDMILPYIRNCNKFIPENEFNLFD